MSKAEQHQDDIFAFLVGAMAGIVVGGIAAVLLAPRSGKETREMLGDLSETLKEDWENPYGKTHAAIDRTRYTVTNQIDRVQQSRKAKRLASAKQLEESQAGAAYDYQ